MPKDRTERALILGAGIAGLFAAMTLARPGRSITVLDRDPEPPEGADADQVFQNWHRRGVGHLRHSHAFLARLVNSLRARHPALLAQLQAAGCREMTLADMLPSTLRDRYTPEPSDAQLSILMSRRTTFELITRRYVAGLPGVTIRPDVFVTGLLTRRLNDQALMVDGVQTEAGEELRAPAVIDATGRLTQTGDWLAAEGAALPDGGAPAGILYFTRHWRLKPGQEAPTRNGAPGAGDLGYLKYGLFNADNGWFSVTLALPEVETELRQAIVHAKTFETICRALPGVEPWIEPERATPETKVFAMGDLASHWRRMVVHGRPLAQGLYLIGDGLIRSNPLYGRGTSFAMIEAEALARALDASADPTIRAVLYDSLVEQALKPFYDDMLQQDEGAIRRADALREGRPDTLRGQMTRRFIRDAAGIAVRDDLPAFRAALRAFHMLDPPRAWLADPRNMGVVLRTWARGRRRNAHLYPARLGPERDEMLALLELQPASELSARTNPFRAARTDSFG